MFKRLFKPRPAELAGQALYATAVAQARRPIFYADWGAPDTPEGRFELYTLHVVLLLRRLKGQGPQADETALGVLESYMGALDIALRELGTGDLSMAKKMKKLQQAFFGRLKHFDDAFAALPDQTGLSALVGRTITESDEQARRFVAYSLTAEAAITASSIETLLDGRVEWPEPAI